MPISPIYTLSIQVGETPSERRFVWTAEPFSAMFLYYAKKSDLAENERLTEQNAKKVTARLTPIFKEKGRICAKAEIDSLESDTEYLYRIGNEEEIFPETYHFSTQKYGAPLSFALISDLHMNARYPTSEEAIRYKTDRWHKTLSQMKASTPNLSFLVSAGDNVSSYAMPLREDEDMHTIGHREHIHVFSSPILHALPFASVMGNHEANPKDTADESASVSEYYYNLPNDDGQSGHYLGGHSAGNFYLCHENVLLIGIDFTVRMNANCTATHEEASADYVRRACEAYPDAKWRILVNHIPAYAFIGNSNEGKEMALAEPILSRICDENRIDVLFTGHSHAFSRTNPIKGGVIGKETEKGTVYYNLPSALAHSFNTPVRAEFRRYCTRYGLHDYAAKTYIDVHGEEFDGLVYSSPMYTVTTADGNTLSVRLYRSDTNECIDTLILQK